MPGRARQPGKVIPLRRSVAGRVRVIVRGPSDPAAAEALRRAIVRDLAGLAVELLADGRLPEAAVAQSAASKP